ncbi:MAG TPA: RpoE-regulated lipoprotein, partial [Pantoea agglomerans]|nr:RpoE-regulated lipoprotein [Pantoea agglomerans]
ALGIGTEASVVEGTAPGSQHLTHVYKADKHGKVRLMASDGSLKIWRTSKIVWQR